MSEMLDTAAKALTKDMGIGDWEELSDDPLALLGKPTIRLYARAVIMALEVPTESVVARAKERWKKPPVCGLFSIITHGYEMMFRSILEDIQDD